MIQHQLKRKAPGFLRRLSRRDLFRGSTLAALTSFFRWEAGEAAQKTAFPITTYQSLGVEPTINCWGTMTVLGGSLMLPEVMQAMQKANEQFVHMPELIEGAGKRLAELTGAEWGCVTAGAASAIYACTAACVAGNDEAKKQRLPFTEGMKNEAIIPKQHYLHYFEAATRMVGLKLLQVDSKGELESAISSNTAVIYIVGELARPGYHTVGNLAYEDIIEVARRFGVPSFVDAAAERPDVPNYYLESGADLVCYSGGKCLQGPQSAGILIGRKDICKAAALHLSPYSGIGRTQKVGKEEILGVLTALDIWINGRDHEGEFGEWERVLEVISDRITQVPSVRTTVVQPGRASNVAPTMSIDWDQSIVPISHEEFQRQLSEGYPRIKIATFTGDAFHTRASAVMPYMMRPGDEIPVARRMYEVLAGALETEGGARPR